MREPVGLEHQEQHDGQADRAADQPEEPGEFGLLALPGQALRAASCPCRTIGTAPLLRASGDEDAVPVSDRALELIERDPSLAAPEVAYLVNFIRSAQRGVILRRPSKRFDDMLDTE